MLFMLAGLLFHGCAGIYSMVEFEILEPATVSFPPEVKQLIILNRAPLTMDVLEEEDRTGMKPKQLIMLDTIIVNNLNRGLLSVLQRSPIKFFHHPFWISDRRRDTAKLDDLILTRREVQALCQELAGDAVLSLESYNMDYNEVARYFSDNPGQIRTLYYEIAGTVRWNIYLPGNPRPFDTYIISDTLFFTEVMDGVLLNYYPVERMIRETFTSSGIKYGRYLVPIWVHASRRLYKGREDSLKLASRYTDRGEWDQAYGIWKALSLSEDSTMVAKSLHNMAVYHELEDELDSASILVGRAMEYDSLEAVSTYSEELEMRILNRKEVIKQVR